MKLLLDLAPGIVAAFVLLGVGYFIYLTVTKGLPAAIAWAKTWWTKAKKDFAALEARVLALEQKVGIAKPAPAPAPAPAAWAPAPAPAPAA
ncbi:MAG: hypothetical protein ABSA68_13375 [Xanthobacteraceae bacterium]|jgi:hypothetical protein